MTFGSFASCEQELLFFFSFYQYRQQNYRDLIGMTLFSDFSGSIKLSALVRGAFLCTGWGRGVQAMHSLPWNRLILCAIKANATDFNRNQLLRYKLLLCYQPEFKNAKIKKRKIHVCVVDTIYRASCGIGVSGVSAKYKMAADEKDQSSKKKFGSKWRKRANIAGIGSREKG
jgi:hypothetical protein